MSTRIITNFGRQTRSGSRSRDALIILSAAIFAIGFVLLLMVLPSNSQQLAADDVSQTLAGP